MNPHTLTFWSQSPMYRTFVRVRVIGLTLTFTLTSTLTFWVSLTSYLLHLTSYLLHLSYHSPLTPKKVRVKVRVNRSTLTCLQPFVYRAFRPVW